MMRFFDTSAMNNDAVICESCDLVFDIDQAATELDDFGRKAPVCPNCGSGDLTDFDESDYDDEEELD